MGLKKGEKWLEGLVEVQKEIFSYFANHFENVGWKRPHLYGVEFLILSFA